MLVHLGRFTVATVVAHQVSILVVLVAATVLLLAAASEESYAEGDDLAHLTLQSTQTGAIAPSPAAAGDDALSPLLAGEGLGLPLESNWSGRSPERSWSSVTRTSRVLSPGTGRSR